jgi:hypothetical protein
MQAAHMSAAPPAAKQFSLRHVLVDLAVAGCCCCWLLLQGCFSVSAQMPVHYTVQEVHGIFNTHNKVGGLAAQPLRIALQTDAFAAVCPHAAAAAFMDHVRVAPDGKSQ